MLWSGGYDVLRQYRLQLEREADAARLGGADMVRTARRRAAFGRLVNGVLGNGGR